MRNRLLVLSLLVFGTIVLTYPQAFRLSDAVGNHYDALFSIWRLGWIAHSLKQGTHLFDANIFYPERLTFAYSDAILLPGLIGAPLAWAGIKPATVYNLLVLATFPATGFAMYVVVQALTGSLPAAILSAFIFAFSPYRIAHLPQLELLWMWPIPLAFNALHDLAHAPTPRRASLLAVWVVAQALGCLYYAAFLCLGLAILAGVALVGRPWRSVTRSLVWIAVAAALAGIALWPYLHVYRTASTLLPARSILEVATWSAHWVSYASVLDTSLLYRLLGHSESLEMTLFPGLLAVSLALYGIRPLSRLTVGYVLLAWVAIDLSLGVNGSGLFEFLFYRVGFVGALRVPARTFALLSASIAVLAGFGLSKSIEKLQRLCAPPVVLAAISFVFAAVAIEFWSAPLHLMALDVEPPVVYRWLAVQPEAVVLEWPLPGGSSVGLTHEPTYMYYSTFHWKPLVNGYSGHYPDSYIRLLDDMIDFPSDSSIRALHGRGVTHVILHGEYDQDAFAQTVDAMTRRPEFESVIKERRPKGDVAVFGLRP